MIDKRKSLCETRLFSLNGLRPFVTERKRPNDLYQVLLQRRGDNRQEGEEWESNRKKNWTSFSLPPLGLESYLGRIQFTNKAKVCTHKSWYICPVTYVITLVLHQDDSSSGTTKTLSVLHIRKGRITSFSL